MDQLDHDVRSVVAAELMLDPARVSDALGPGDVSRWDSVGHLQVVRALERRFGITFTVSEVMAIASVRDLITMIRQRQG